MANNNNVWPGKGQAIGVNKIISPAGYQDNYKLGSLDWELYFGCGNENDEGESGETYNTLTTLDGDNGYSALSITGSN